MSRHPIIPRMLLCGMLLGVKAGSASVSFRSPVNYTVGTNPSAVAVGDFNGDGKRDIAVVNSGDSSKSDPGGVSILLGNGDGTFQSAMNFGAGNNPRYVAVGDVDGDGKDDLIVARPGVQGSSDKGDVRIFLSNGDGTFRNDQLISTFSNPTSVVTADLNSDGAIDLAVSDATSINILLGKGDGTFHATATYLPATDKLGENSPARFFVLDFDHDGKEDLGFAVGLPNNIPHTLEVLLGNGDGTFQSASIVRTFSSNEQPTFSADFNHDGNVDVILYACGFFGGGCGGSLFLSNGDGTFSDPPGTNVLTDSVYAAGDFDGDGNLDLAGTLASNNVPQLAIYIGNGDGSFQQPATFTAAASATNVALAADLNNDIAPDVLSLAGANAISVTLNSGTDFTLSASPLTPSSIGLGQSSTSTVSLQLLNLFNNPVALSCSIQPAQTGAPKCALSTNSVTFDASGKTSAKLTISLGSLALLNNPYPVNLGPPIWFLVNVLALLGMEMFLRANKRALFRMLPFAALLGLISLQACGGGGGPKSTNYAITITGTSGQTSHSTTLNVTVQ